MLLGIPDWFTYLVSLLFGLVIGSFLNVVVVRLPHGESLIKPGSHCPKCKKSIRWWDNIPILSYLLLQGKCRNCSAKISIRYPIIEFLTAIVFLAARYHVGWNFTLLFRDWPFLAILIAITFIDLEHRIIPDVLSLGGLVFGLLTCWMNPDLGWIQSVLGAVGGFCFFYSVAWIYYQWRGRSGLGGGDIKLLAMLGAFLGPSGVFSTIFISSIFGSIVGVVWALARGRKNVLKLSLPFGPFLVTGALYYYLIGDILWLRFMTPM